MIQFMKKILALIVSVVAVSSCLGGSAFSDSYTSYATFEYADDYNKRFGEDSLYVETEFKVGFAWADYLAFGHKLDEDNELEGGFLLSYLSVPESGNTENLENNIYRANQTYSPPGKNTYVVFYKSVNMPERHFWFNYVQGEIKGTCTPQFVRVNNSVAVIEAIKKSFDNGDTMTLKATGFLGENRTGEAQIRLAEKDSVISSWTVFELSQLGVVDRVNFDIILPEDSEIPQVVCMDDFTASLAFTADN